MKTKVSPSSVDASRLRKVWNVFATIVVILNLLLIFSFSSFAIYKVIHIRGDMYEKKAKLYRFVDKLVPGFKNWINLPEMLHYRLKSVFIAQETISIDMKHINVQKLEYMRQSAIQNDRAFEYVPAVISHDGENVKIKIRLKGDRFIHWDNIDTSSYRIKVKGDHTLFGMKTFSMHKPRARNYIYESVYLLLMDYSGIMSPQYKFVQVNFNGKNLGVYAIEEHYDKYLIERHRKREGPIIRFREDGSKYQFATVAPYVSKKWTKPENLPMTQKAVHLLEGYRRGELSVSQVFDVDKLAMFFALVDLTGTHHGSVPKSLRFYYNPVTSRLEPIPFDGHFGTIPNPVLSSEIGLSEEQGKWIYALWKEWFISLFNDPGKLDPDFIRAYVAALSEVSSETFVDNFFSEVADEIDQAKVAIYSELPLQDRIFSYGPGVFKFERSSYDERAMYIRRKLSDVRITAHLAASSGHEIEIDVSRIDRHLPLEILDLDCGDIKLKPNPETNFLVATKPATKPENHTIRFSIPPDQANNRQVEKCNKLNFRILGTNDRHSTEIYPWPRYDHELVSTDILRSKPNYSEFDFISTDAKQKELHILPGSHTISTNLIFPPGYTVVAGPGTKILLNNNALILSRSPLRFNGTEKDPIEITSHDYTGQGILVIKASSVSVLEHVNISDMHNPNQQGWSIPGAVTFYESPIKMISVSVQNNKSEDAINIIRSSFDLYKLHISDTLSDALDIDFGKGVISQSLFVNAGNDAIDISGTEIEMQDIEVLSAGDKGISIGEGSRATVKNIKLNGAKFGVVSKDNSILRIDDLSILKSKVAIAAYQKKPEFGPGTIYIDNFKFDGDGSQSLIEQGSLLVLNGENVQGEQINVEKILLALPEQESLNTH